MTTLRDALARYGATVVEVVGWEDRAVPGPWHPVGILAHHTANPNPADAPSLDVVIHGRAGLNGPLANVVVSRRGIIYLVSAGRCNHAGMGSSLVRHEVEAELPPGLDARERNLPNDESGNGWYYALEFEHAGDGSPWPAAQLDAGCRAMAGICDWHEWAATRVRHHRQHTDRKVDMSYRGDLWTPIASLLAGDPPPAPQPAPVDDDDDDLEDDQMVIYTADNARFHLRHADGTMTYLKEFGAKERGEHAAFGVFVRVIEPAELQRHWDHSNRILAR